MAETDGWWIQIGYDDNENDLSDGVLNDSTRNLFDGFVQHLQTMDGGLKNEKSALSHRGVLIRLYTKFLKVENFLNKRCLDLWVKASRKQG